MLFNLIVKGFDLFVFMSRIRFCLLVFFFLSGIVVAAQKKYNINYDEGKIPQYILEDPLVFENGKKVHKLEWRERREEILQLFQREMYGKLPPVPDTVLLETIEEGLTMSGHAKRSQVKMWFRKDKTGPSINWLILTPTFTKRPVPVVMMLNYYGNHTVVPDKEVLIPNVKYHMREHLSIFERGWMQNTNSRSIIPTNMILARGYAYITACYEEVSPDPDGRENQDRYAYTRIFELWGQRDTTRSDNTTSIMAWAWALMRGMDMIESNPSLDEKKVLITGSSRLGKVALVAGAFDERFSIVVPNQTGGGGAPLNKRHFGENVQTEVHDYSHWYCRAFDKYVENESAMPFDQHLLLACVAPRALMIQGFDEAWFDTKGEFLALQAASPVWRFLGKEGLPQVEFPSDYDRSAIGSCVAYYHRPLSHGIATIDWQWMLDFANQYWMSL